MELALRVPVADVTLLSDKDLLIEAIELERSYNFEYDCSKLSTGNPYKIRRMLQRLVEIDEILGL